MLILFNEVLFCEKNHYYCKLDEEQIVLLEKYEIDAEEYETFGNSIEDEYICIICNLAELADDLYYAKESGPGYENLVSDQEKYKELQELRKGYHYYKNFNYWFADWNEEMTDYVQTQISPELKSFVSKDFVWEKDKDTAERKAMSYMDNYEAGIQQLSENKKAEEEKNSEENTKEQKNIFLLMCRWKTGSIQNSRQTESSGRPMRKSVRSCREKMNLSIRSFRRSYCRRNSWED